VNCWFAPRPIDVELGETWIEETVGVGLELCVCELPPPFEPQAVSIDRTSSSAVLCMVFMHISGSKNVMEIDLWGVSVRILSDPVS